MFNRCWRWRALLARRAEGHLSPAQSGMLRSHLAQCARCRMLTEADDALNDVLGISAPHMDESRTRAFDDRVVAALAAPARPARFDPMSAWTRFLVSMKPYCQSLPFDFMAQIGGGAILAVSLTSFFLVPALHSSPSRPAPAGTISEKLARESAERSTLPVPMESLLNTPSPRAAMLWTVPEHRKERHWKQLPDASPSTSSPRPTSAAPQTQPEKAGRENHSRLEDRNKAENEIEKNEVGKAVG